MGMDQWVRVKTTAREYHDGTGACSGLFPLVPKDDGLVEIGYLRKAYDQDTLISEYLDKHEGDPNCKNIKLVDGAIDGILDKAREILATHKFDEEGYDITPDASDFDTWGSKRKWEDVVKFFEEAKQIKEEDPEAEFYYCCWW